MDLNKLIKRVRNHPDFAKAGMILSHIGIVRESSRDGRPVKGLKIAVDYKKLESIINEQKSHPGIVEILVEIAEQGKMLETGDDIMFIVVAGDIRENVIEALSDTLNAIKQTVTEKTEFFA